MRLSMFFDLRRMQFLATNIAVLRPQTHGKDHNKYVKPSILLDYQVTYHKSLFPRCSFYASLHEKSDCEVKIAGIASARGLRG